MKNWAGNFSFTPKNIFAPKNITELQDIIKKAAKEKNTIRFRGSGHSWAKLIETDDIFLHLDHMQGMIDCDHETKRLKVLAGTKLHQLGNIAYSQGLAMPNQGDINKQSIAGATSTGTHGTGLGLQSISNQIHDLTLILANGEKISINENDPELFYSARLGLGALGVMAETTLQLIPAYKLKVATFVEEMNSSLKVLNQRIKQHRHVEMFYFPLGDWSIVKIMDPTDEADQKKSLFEKLNEVIVENWSYEMLNIIAGKTGQYKKLDSFMRKFCSPLNRVGWSHDIFPTQRSLKFMEMEYNIPLEHFEEAFAEIKATIKASNFQTLFPIEIRFVKGDSLWLSPASGRDSVYFAIHTYITEDYRPYFLSMETIFKKYQGRPHWGKWHNLGIKELEQVYPKFHDFRKLRERLDPQGVFLNSHLKHLLGI